MPDYSIACTFSLISQFNFNVNFSSQFLRSSELWSQLVICSADPCVQDRCMQVTIGVGVGINCIIN